MQVCQCTEVWHASIFLCHLLNSVICFLETLVHCCLGSSHLGLHFFDSLNVTIVFLLLHWRWDSWLTSQLFLFHCNFLIDSLLSSNKHFLQLSCLSLGLGHSLNVLTIFIYGWILSCLLGSLLGLFLGLLREISFLLSSIHFIEWFFFGNKRSSGLSNGDSLIDISGCCNLDVLFSTWFLSGGCSGSLSFSFLLSLSLC